MDMEELNESINKIKSQRQKRHKAAMSSVKVRALATIEGMILAVEPEDKMLGACYRFAHAALGDCGNPHNDWINELDETYKKLRNNNVI